MGYEDFRVTGLIEPVETGRVKVSTTVPAQTNEEAAFLIFTRNGTVRPGEAYTLLHVGGVLQMSDTRDEWSSHAWFIHQAHGSVLVNGLGLGCSLKAILAKPSVEHVDVVEIDADVLAVIGPYFESDRVTFHHADAFSMRWPRGTRWNVGWHDIWPTICEDDLAEHAKLLRSYGQRCDWQGAWKHEELQRLRRRDYAWAW